MTSIFAAIIVVLFVATCNLTDTIKSTTFLQIELNLSRLAFHALTQIRLHLEGINQMSATPVPVIAESAEAFDQSIGVNVHMSYTWTPYANVGTVESDLAYLGVDHVRDELVSNALTSYEELAAAGIKFDFAIPVYPSSPVNPTEFVNMVSAFVQAYPGSVSAIEGPNEVNFWPATFDGGTTYADQAALQQALYNAVQSEPTLAGIPVYNLTIGSTVTSEFSALGDLSAYANYGNEHAYVWDWGTPAAGLSYLLTFPQIDTPGLPTVITETGYETNVADTYSGVDQTVQAKFTLDTVMDAFKDGVPETYFYELIDEGGQYFGLFTANGTPKLAATAIHDLTTLLNDPNGASSFTPGSLSYTVANLPTSGNQLLLEKSNGAFDLMLWAEAPIWNTTTESEIAAPTETSTVEFGQTQKVVLVFDPLLSTEPIAAYLNTQSIQVGLTDHPIVVETPAAIPTLATPLINGFVNSGTAKDGITLTGTAAANGTVLVFDDASQIGTAVANASGIWSFTTGTLSSGSNAFTSMAVDAAGNVSGISTEFDVTISAPSSAAAVSVPIINDYAIVNTNQLLLTGEAEANTTLSIFDGTTLLGTTSANASGAWSYTSSSLANGTYTLTATATDAAGNTSAASNAVDPTVDLPPTVTSFMLSGVGINNGGGEANTGTVITLTFTMSDVVTVTGGAPTLTLSDGGTATYSGGSGTNTLTYSYTVAAGDSTTDLTVTGGNFNGADIEDLAGNAVVGGVPNPTGVVQINTTATALTGTLSGTISIANGTTRDTSGTVDNTGTIALNAAGSPTDLAVVGAVTLTGSGNVTLSNNAGNVITSNGAPATLTNVNNTISGAGTIGDNYLTLVNQGTINANQTVALVINTGGNAITNSGTLEGSSSGGLDLESNVSNARTIEALGTNAKVVIESIITNSTTGLILASGSGAQVDLAGATISGGTLQTSGSNAYIETVGGGTDVLNAITIKSGSIVEINGGTTLLLDGTVGNSGTFLVNGGTFDVDGVLAGGATEIGGAGKMIVTQASSENVSFLSRSTGQLVLDQATSYTGEISGLGTTQSIDLTDINFAAGVKISYASNNRRNTSGVLTITEGTNTVRLELAGSYTLANFHVASDGNGGTLLTDPTVISQRPGNASETIANNTVLEINTPDKGNVTFSGTNGTLWLDQPATFTGKVSGFGAQNAIDLPGIAFGSTDNPRLFTE